MVFGTASVALSPPANAQATSAHYRLEPVTINGGGAPATSANKRLIASLGQELTIGASSSPHYIAQSGFWGFLGSTVVPVVLTAVRNPVRAVDVDLSWSGNNASYALYRNTDCASIFANVLVTTANRVYIDTSAPLGGLTCYNVLADAPGPIPPPLHVPSP